MDLLVRRLRSTVHRTSPQLAPQTTSPCTPKQRGPRASCTAASAARSNLGNRCEASSTGGWGGGGGKVDRVDRPVAARSAEHSGLGCWRRLALLAPRRSLLWGGLESVGGAASDPRRRLPHKNRRRWCHFQCSHQGEHGVHLRSRVQLGHDHARRTTAWTSQQLMRECQRCAPPSSQRTPAPMQRGAIEHGAMRTHLTLTALRAGSLEA